MKKCLVTGAAGFVGSHLVDRLLGDGHEVVGLDNFYTGFSRNIEHLLPGRKMAEEQSRSGAPEPRFSLVEHDVTLPFPAIGRFDWIFNLACPASPPHYQRDRVYTTVTCFNGALHCLRLAKEQRARMLQASTSEVYGDPRVHPQPESYRGFVNPVGPRACYDEGKRAAEALCADFRQQHDVDARIARIFNTYGPRMDPNDGRVVSNFIVQALRGEPLTMYGDGTQTRSFCYVDDLVDGMMRLMSHAEEAGPVNLGNDGEFTMIELAQLVLRLTGSRSQLVHRELPADDPTRRRPDLTLARARLGYEPKVSLEEGIERTLAHFRAIVAREEHA